MKKLLPLFVLCLSAMGFAQTPVLLSKPVNTQKITEYAPTLSANGKTLVFQSNRNRYKAWYLYESTQQTNGKWSNPKIIESIRAYAKKPSETNDFQTDFIAAPHLSADGNTLYFSATFHSGLGGRDIYYVTRQADGKWSRPVNAGEVINSDQHEDFPSIAPNGKTLYFARPLNTTKASKSCYQLLVAKKNKHNRWQRPEILPYPINTGCEKCPRIQADGVTLLFSSLRKGGKGGYDLYKTVLGIRGKKWEQTEAVKELNTPAFEKFATILKDNSQLYYNTQGKHSPDVFVLSPVPNYLHLQRVIQIHGIISGLDPKNKQPVALQAGIAVYLKERQPRNLLQTVPNNPRKGGQFGLALRKGHRYILVANAKGYEPEKLTIDLRNWQQDTYQIAQPLVLAPVQVSTPFIAKNNLKDKGKTKAMFVDTRSGKIVNLTNTKESNVSVQDILKDNPHLKLFPVRGEKANNDYTKLVFPHIHFAYKSSELNQQGQTYLYDVLMLLKAVPELKLQINAHTDQTGVFGHNQQLSEQRAVIVKQYFVNEGIAASRLTTKGLGATQPLANGNNAQNRRVELKVFK